MVNIKTSSRNNETRLGLVAVGTLTYTQPKSGVIKSGETYQIGTIPAGSVVTGVRILVDKAYNGTSPTADIGIVGSTTLYANDLDLDTVGVTAGVAGTNVYYSENTDIVITPTIAGANTGSVKVLVEYLQPGSRTGSFTA